MELNANDEVTYTDTDGEEYTGRFTGSIKLGGTTRLLIEWEDGDSSWEMPDNLDWGD